VSKAVADLENILPTYAARWLRPTFRGDVDAARDLCAALPSYQRGFVARAMWAAKAPVMAYRAYLGEAWDRDQAEVIAAAETRHRLGFMFRYAAFVLPADVPQQVRVWRGVSGVSFSAAVTGYSWTTCRDVACWFALRYSGPTRLPLVITAKVQKGSIARFNSGRIEREAVLFTPPVAAVTDGLPDDWMQGFQRFREKVTC
jgi:hypothetical protein